MLIRVDAVQWTGNNGPAVSDFCDKHGIKYRWSFFEVSIRGIVCPPGTWIVWFGGEAWPVKDLSQVYELNLLGPGPKFVASPTTPPAILAPEPLTLEKLNADQGRSSAVDRDEFLRSVGVPPSALPGG